MAVFEYQAISKAGKTVKGVIDAENPAAARRKLREQELHPTRISESAATERGGTAQETSGGWGRVSVRDTALMTRQLGTLLQAGMPLVEALSALLDQTTRVRLKKAVYTVREKVNSGRSLADSLAEHPRIFSDLYVNMVRAGEAGGALETVLFRLAEMLERQAKLRSRIMTTMAYPVFLSLFAVAIITFLVVVIVPRITMIIEKQGGSLPMMTRVLISTSHFAGRYGWLVAIGIVLIFIAWRAWISRVSGRLRWDRFKLRVPLYGNLYLKILTARFARTLGTMLQSGMTMLVALDVVKTISGNRHIDEVLDEVRSGVRRGKDLAMPLKESGVFPPLMLHMVDLGQRSGELEQMLIRVADTYEEDVQATVDAIVGLIEPVIIVVMGVFVGFLVLAILLPILNMSSNI